MNRRTLDLLVPLTYVIAVMATTVFANALVVGAVFALGAVAVAAYYAVFRPKSKV